MASQLSTNYANLPLLRSGEGLQRDNETIAQDAGRTAPLLRHTIMSQDNTTLKWEPLTVVTAQSEGTDIPAGIYLGGDIPAADLVAGDVTGCVIMIGGSGAVITEDMITLENSLTVDDVVVARAQTVRAVLAHCGLFLSDSIDLGSYQS